MGKFYYSWFWRNREINKLRGEMNLNIRWAYLNKFVDMPIFDLSLEIEWLLSFKELSFRFNLTIDILTKNYLIWSYSDLGLIIWSKTFDNGSVKLSLSWERLSFSYWIPSPWFCSTAVARAAGVRNVLVVLVAGLGAQIGEREERSMN